MFITLREKILSVKANIEAGNNLSESLKKHPKIWDSLYCNLIEVGEVGGILDTILRRLAAYIEKAEKLKNKEDLSSKKQIVFKGTTDHLILHGDEEQIKQVVWNLCINALEAMSQGTLTLSLKEVFSFRSGEFQANHRGMVLEVQDEGCGIALDQINNIYDPFYSSKKDGVGLGLATVYQIVNRNGGIMDVESTLGTGTLFTVFLPDQESEKPVPLSSH